MIRHLILSAAGLKAAGGQTADVVNEDPASFGQGLFICDVTGFTGGTAPSVTFIVEGLDTASGKYIPLLTSVAVTAAGTTLLRVGPGLQVTANVSTNDVLFRIFRVRYTFGGAPTGVTFSIGCSLT